MKWYIAIIGSCLILYYLAIPVEDAIWFSPCSFFFFFFSPPLLSGPYLWNRYSQRLQIVCAAWSCCLILHYSLPSNSLRYFIFIFYLFFFFFRQDFVRAISLELLLAETPNWVCCLVLRSNFAMLLTIQFAWLFFIFFFFATILSGPYLWNRYSQRLQIECAPWSCCLILHCCLPSNSLRYFFFFSATLLVCFSPCSIGPKFGVSLLGRIQGDREPVSLLLLLFLLLFRRKTIQNMVSFAHWTLLLRLSKEFYFPRFF